MPFTVKFYLWREFWHRKFWVKFLLLCFQAKQRKWLLQIHSWNKWSCFHANSERIKGKKLMMLLAEDYFFLHEKNKILAKSTSRTEISLNTLFRNFKALEENWTGGSESSGTSSQFPGSSRHWDLSRASSPSPIFGRCLCREEKALLHSLVNVFQSPCPYPALPLKFTIWGEAQQRNPFSGATGPAQIAPEVAE